MKKSLLLIFGLMGLVSLMAESGPKRNNVLSMLGLVDAPACCDVSVCCTNGSPDCCDLSTCCNTTSTCCAPASSCCASYPTDQSTTSTTENKVSQCFVQCTK